MLANLRIIAVFFLLFTLNSCGKKEEVHHQEETHVSVNPSYLPNIRTIRVTSSNQLEELILSGMVEADPDKEMSYVALTSGVIDKVYFTLGDPVKKGQVLLDIRSTDLNSLQPELVSLENEVKIAQRELATAQDLFQDQMISERELLEAQSKLNQAQAEMGRVQTDISVYGSAKPDGSFSIHAPISGYITRKNASSGSTASVEGEPLFTIVDLSSVWITVNVYASDLMFVREGLESEITTLSYPGETFAGKISKLSQVFDPEDKALKAKITLENKDLKLKPGMPVVVKLKNQNLYQFVSVPSEALIFDNDAYFVVVRKSPDEFEIREVTLQGHNHNVTYLRSGLSEGEEIVVKNQLLIYSHLTMDV